MTGVRDVAKMIDHSVLHPTLTDEDLLDECEVAREYRVASACVKPYAVRRAAEELRGTDVHCGAVVGFPHGNQTHRVKAFETEQALRDGAEEIDMVVNVGKVLQEDWSYLEREVEAVAAETADEDAMLKVIFETDFLPEDGYVMKLCEICNERRVDFVKTSTGFGYVKVPDGHYDYTGATVHDVELMDQYTEGDLRVKAAGGIRDLDALLEMKEAGASRIGATATVDIMEEARERFG